MLYELTVTLRPQLYRHTAKEQFNATRHAIEDILRSSTRSQLRPKGFFTAIAELTGENNVHYHCLVDLEDLEAKDNLLNRFRGWMKIFGRKTCSQVLYEDSYKNYMQKDLQSSWKVIGCPVIRDDYDCQRKLFPVP